MTAPINAASSKHFTRDEEDALRNDTTNGVLARDTKVGDLRGCDKTHRETKTDQQHIGKGGALEIAWNVKEGLEYAGIELVPHGLAGAHGVAGAAGLAAAVGAAGAIVSPLATMGFGLHALAEAKRHGAEQNSAVQRENARAALVTTLDLPPAYKRARLNDLTAVTKDADGAPTAQSAAGKMQTALIADRKGLAVLQLHADRGMSAARDMIRSNMTLEEMQKKNPRFTAAYASDAAFREGFDAYVFTKDEPTRKALDAALEERDARYSQSQIALRV